MRFLRISKPCLCFCLAAQSVWAAQITVTVSGVYDTANGVYFMVSTGLESVDSSSVSSVSPFVEYVTYYDTYGDWTYDSEGNYVWQEWTTPRTEPDWSTQRTEYTVTVPDTWIGHSLTFSWSGGDQYTAYQPFFEDGATFTFTESDWVTFGLPPEQQNSHTYPDYLSNRMVVGRWWDDGARALLTMNTWDNFNAYWPGMGLDLIASRPNAFWRWIHPADSGTGSEIAMDLDYLHRLTLRGRNAANQRIVLDPNLGQITINGSPAITYATGQNFFASRTGGTLLMGQEAKAPHGGVAIGYYSAAFADPSTPSPTPDIPVPDPAYYTNKSGTGVALGDYSRANARGVIAIGSHASGTQSYALAFGGYASASGLESVALGLKSEATNTASVALGAYAKAQGTKSTALGYRTVAKGYGQTVVGVNNVPVGTDNPVDATSEVFVVGSGAYEYVGTTPVSTLENAFTVKRNGDTKVTGRLDVVGEGESVINGDLRVNGVLRVQEQGDLSMGGFMSGPQP